MKEGAVVTFYSYKGGVGRTLALANIGALLCRWGYKVLCIDWDLEAPGLHLYFKPWMEREPQAGLTELLQAYVDRQTPDWRAFATEVSFSKTDSHSRLSLISAGRQDCGYVQKMQALDWKALYEEHDLGTFLEQLRDQWKAAFDFILIDSRTGVTDAGGICTVQMPDLLVLLFTANEQSLHGALEVARRARQARDAFPFDRSKLLTLPIATRFEARIEYELAQQWLGRFAEALAPLYAEWAHKDSSPAELLNHTRIPYIPYWSFGEKLPVIEKGTGDPEDLGYPLETLAALIAQRFSYSEVLLRNRDAFVAGAKPHTAAADKLASSPTQPKPLVHVFISYSRKDQKFLQELKNHLAPLERLGIMRIWSDTMVDWGDDWQKTINAYLEEAQIILLLISPDYLASHYAYEVEMARALEKSMKGEAIAIPVILRPCLWQDSPIGQLQATPPFGAPVAEFPNQDEAWVQVIQRIQQAIDTLQRPFAPQQMDAKQETFDVFLSHNSEDKPIVQELAQALKSRGLRVWLDEEQLIPGRPWQEALDAIIETTHAAAVLIGKNGLGPWEWPEMRACLREFVRRQRPVIPVLLPGAPAKSELPLFLRGFTWIDLSNGLTDEGMEKLAWGITGAKPKHSV
jgi:MinD-like ATPase involved in chromosome partitioning or flagellar assembly/nucleotide-binding universal stress UspA family protein